MVVGVVALPALGASCVAAGQPHEPRATIGYKYDSLAASTTAPTAVRADASGERARRSIRPGASSSSISPRRAAKGLSTGADEAVFWSGIRGGDSVAAKWVGEHGGATLETTLAKRGIKLPAWDASDAAVVAAWRNASRDFAAGARGSVRVLQDSSVRTGSVWAQVEYPALRANRHVSSITAVNPRTGAETLLWRR